MRTLVLFDGQNLFRSAKDAWGPSYPYDHPSYDVELLAQRLVSLTPGRTLEEIRFYTGVYRKDQDWERHWFWTNKLDHLETQGVYVYRGRVRGGLNEAKQEKGVDVSLSIDLIQATHKQRYDVAIILSKDSDIIETVADYGYVLITSENDQRDRILTYTDVLIELLRMYRQEATE